MFGITFPGMFGAILRNITFPLFPAFRSPFLYIQFYTQPFQKVCYLSQMKDLDYWKIYLFLLYTADNKKFFWFLKAFDDLIIAFRKDLETYDSQ